MSATPIIDRRAAPPQASPAADMAAHLVALTALVMALTRKVVEVLTADEREALLALWAAESEKLAAQYSGDVPGRAAKLTGTLAEQLRTVTTTRPYGFGG